MPPTSDPTDPQPTGDSHAAAVASTAVDVAPHPGVKEMPAWSYAELGSPPIFTWRQLPWLIGPGLVMGAAAVGGGEWLTGPLVTAKYGGVLLWLATISILGQAIYNIEVSRYTLYTGEPIFTGKFRTPPGPQFWLIVYLLLDFGSFLPYLASNAAIPLLALLQGELPDTATQAGQIKFCGSIIFVLMLLPLVVGGKVYDSLKVLMTLKLVIVIGFLMFLAVFYSSWSTWAEIGLGFLQFGTLPVQTAEGELPRTANVFAQWWNGQSMPPLDLSMVGFIAAMAAIAGNGGLTNAPISNFTRDQGWGMGKEVGAIPSITQRHSITLSHAGKVFRLTPESLKKWTGWVRHVQREQLYLWVPACFIGMGLPSMLSIQFLPRGESLDDKWLAAGMTADGVAAAVGPSLGQICWGLTLFCGFLVLVTAAITTADGVLRRWVDVFWTSSERLRTWDPKDIGLVYFGALCFYAIFGLITLNFIPGDRLLIWTTNFYNYALGFSCWHVVFVNTLLLPRALRPSLFRLGGLFVAGCFFTFIAVLTTADSLGFFKG